MVTGNFRYLYAVVCLFSLSVNICLNEAFAENPRDDSVDVASLKTLKDEIQPNESNLQQAVSSCAQNSDCRNNGKCEKSKDGTMICSCLNGTSGNKCEIVDDCTKQPSMCGKSKEAQCVFDVEKKKAVCECLNKSKKFDTDVESCAVPCRSYKECGEYGDCYFVTKEYGFCGCSRGASGDLCEIIDQCHSGQVDCGVSPRVKCALRTSGNAFCKCNDTKQGFDSNIKDCRDCNCGPRVFGECYFKDGKKRCACSWGDFFNGDTCEECQCGYGGANNCNMEGGKKICNCYEGYSQRFNKCELCECGPNGGNCTFDEAGNKQCDCAPGYVMTKDRCTQLCNNSYECENGGTCNKVCECPEGTSGDLCKTVAWCANHRCGIYDEADCYYNRTSKEGYCQCKKHKYMWDDELRRCFECDCGVYGECIVTEKGEKVCICENNYADHLLKCKFCYCGYGSVNCSFGFGGMTVCHCKEKYAQSNKKNWRGEDDDATCLPCDCGEHGRCSYNGEIKVCDCDENYKVFNGKCKECNCGPFGYCDFDENGQKTCHCDYGFSVNPKGICAFCNCDPSEQRGIRFNCSLLSGEKNCSCPEGYEFEYSGCQDINECWPKSSCPANTDCVNLPGTYRCDCKKGFETKFEGQDPKLYGCQDIDECRDPSACKAATTQCVNSPGSYDCVCQDGYYPSSGSTGPYYNPKYVTCYKERTQWKVASIILGIIVAVAIVSTAIFISYKRR